MTHVITDLSQMTKVPSDDSIMFVHHGVVTPIRSKVQPHAVKLSDVGVARGWITQPVVVKDTFWRKVRRWLTR